MWWMPYRSADPASIAYVLAAGSVRVEGGVEDLPPLGYAQQRPGDLDARQVGRERAVAPTDQVGDLANTASSTSAGAEGESTVHVTRVADRGQAVERELRHRGGGEPPHGSSGSALAALTDALDDPAGDHRGRVEVIEATASAIVRSFVALYEKRIQGWMRGRRRSARCRVERRGAARVPGRAVPVGDGSSTARSRELVGVDLHVRVAVQARVAERRGRGQAGGTRGVGVLRRSARHGG